MQFDRVLRLLTIGTSPLVTILYFIVSGHFMRRTDQGVLTNSLSKRKQRKKSSKKTTTKHFGSSARCKLSNYARTPTIKVGNLALIVALERPCQSTNISIPGIILGQVSRLNYFPSVREEPSRIYAKPHSVGYFVNVSTATPQLTSLFLVEKNICFGSHQGMQISIPGIAKRT